MRTVGIALLTLALSGCAALDAHFAKVFAPPPPGTQRATMCIPLYGGGMLCDSWDARTPYVVGSQGSFAEPKRH